MLRSRRFNRDRSLAVLSSVAVTTVTCAGGNVLLNASFETAGPLGPTVLSMGFSGVGHSAAESWGVFHNTEGTTLTELVPSTVPGGGDFMLHVVTDGFANGVSQVFAPFNRGYACVEEQVTIHVVNGTVIIGAGIAPGGIAILAMVSRASRPRRV